MFISSKAIGKHQQLVKESERKTSLYQFTIHNVMYINAYILSF